jgi:hypothetical protein
MARSRDQQVRHRFSDQPQGFTAIWRGANVVSAQAEKPYQQITRHHIVIDHKDMLVGKLFRLFSGTGLLGRSLSPRLLRHTMDGPDEHIQRQPPCAGNP